VVGAVVVGAAVVGAAVVGAAVVGAAVVVDPTGVVVEKWILQGTFIQNINFGELDYSRDEIATIQCTLRMDRCIQVF
jgi:hypothetical protein